MRKHITFGNIIRSVVIVLLIAWGYKWGFIGSMLFPLPMGIICIFNFKWD